MSLRTQNWGTIHPSAYRHAFEPVRSVAATLRPRGAIRYRCPVTGSFVLVTDEASLDKLARPPARLRCADCQEIHLVTVAAEDAAVIVAASDKS
jgi:hypothetical protein